MPKRIVNATVMVQREGKLAYPQVGHPFDFTDAEVQSITKSAPKALSKIILADAPAVVAAEPVVVAESAVPKASPLAPRTRSA